MNSVELSLILSALFTKASFFRQGGQSYLRTLPRSIKSRCHTNCHRHARLLIRRIRFLTGRGSWGIFFVRSNGRRDACPHQEIENGGWVIRRCSGYLPIAPKKATPCAFSRNHCFVMLNLRAGPSTMLRNSSQANVPTQSPRASDDPVVKCLYLKQRAATPVKKSPHRISDRMSPRGPILQVY